MKYFRKILLLMLKYLKLWKNGLLLENILGTILFDFILRVRNISYVPLSITFIHKHIS